MKSMVLLTAVLAVFSAAQRKSGAVAVSKKISRREVRESKDQNEKVKLTRRQQDFNKHLGKLQELLKTVKTDLGELCKPGTPASPWCEYKNSLDTSTESKSEERQSMKTLNSRCWPGIPGCRRTLISEPQQATLENLPRTIQRCKPGAVQCAKEKRTFALAPARKQRYCPLGWPWCLS